ncbi:hypothetical protein [Agrobacterium vitis]|uniref:hypothetical protein n=1 Tax=Agrobacterium vitis TaxID=373 RepID=UPI0012E911D8|nr:hypothetical protein [Agrobacterium vitis]MUZ65354.1 hypothetical protein [Agrobacterium vitis]
MGEYSGYDDTHIAELTHTASLVAKVGAFYAALPDNLKSDVLWDVILHSQKMGAPIPTVEALEESVTVDFAAPGVLVSVLIDKDACYLSAFGTAKKVTGTFVLDEVSSKREFITTFESQLGSFRRSYAEV